MRTSISDARPSAQRASLRDAASIARRSAPGFDRGRRHRARCHPAGAGAARRLRRRRAITARWTGSPRRAARRGDPRALWPEVRSIVMLGMNYGPDARSAARCSPSADRGAISVYAQNRDYHDVIKGRLKEIAGKLAARAGGDVKVFVDTAPVMEKPLAEAAGLGWQGKHTNLVSREFGSWLFLGTIFTTAELARRRARGRPLRLLPRLPRRLPDRCLSGALPARCAALHLLPDHREQGADPARIPRSDRQPHLWLRRLPRRLPVEQVRAGRVGGEARRARRSASAAAGRAARARRCRLPRAVLRLAGQAHRPRPLHAQRADRRRQFRRCRAGRPPAARCSTTPRRWCAAPPSGRCRGCCRTPTSRAGRAHIRRWKPTRRARRMERCAPALPAWRPERRA